MGETIFTIGLLGLYAIIIYLILTGNHRRR